MDPFKLLKTDHKKVSQLFKQIESASANNRKAQLFSQLKDELDIHAHIEETLLYPALENKEESREITLEAYEEHKVVKDLLAELATQAPNDEWDAKLTVLRENVEHHVEEEEGELFGKARKVLSRDQIERLGAEMEAEKAAQKNGEPAPAASNRNRATSAKKAPAKSRAASAESPGVLTRLANFVGLGGDSTGAKKNASRKAAKKTGAAKKSTKTAAKKGTKKTAAKTASKGAAKKSAKRQPTRVVKSGRKAAARPGKKAAKKSASKKK